jgi:hypothetical protein
VLVLEKNCCFGGAWQTIDICGLRQVDLGCHLIGIKQELADFFAMYGGCQIVPLNTPNETKNNGFYFAGGCRELNEKLQERLKAAAIDIRYHHFVESAEIDRGQGHVILNTAEEQFTASRVFVTAYTHFGKEAEMKKNKYYHLYLLIHDPTPPRFSYRTGIPHTTRLMNATPYVDLEHTGRQLIILQLHSEEETRNEAFHLNHLKELDLVDKSAYIVNSEAFCFEQWQAPKQQSFFKDNPHYFEYLNTNTLIHMAKYIDRWKEVLQPY